MGMWSQPLIQLIHQLTKTSLVVWFSLREPF